MRALVKQFLDGELSRRSFFSSLVAAGFTAASAESVLRAFSPPTQTGETAGSSISRKVVEGTGGELLAEQLMASGVEYLFGNSGTGDAGFYDALVDRPQLKYVLVPHEGPLAAMAAGYAKASGKTTYLCVAGAVGMANFMGQMLNAYKDETNLVFVAYKREHSEVSGRGVHEEVFDQEIQTIPFTKWHWIAKTSQSIPEVVRRAFRLASTPPFGPVYLGWNHDLLLQKGVRAEIISQEAFQLPMRIRASAKDVKRAARMLLEAEWPILIVGDDLHRAQAIAQAVELAELLAMPVTTIESCFANFPEQHPLFLGEYSSRLRFPPKQDVVINVGNRLHLGPSASPNPLLAPTARFIDMRVETRWLADTFPVDLPLVAGMNEGLEDLKEAVRSEMSTAHKARIEARRQQIADFTAKIRETRASVLPRHSQWNSSPLWAGRLTAELENLMEKDAYVVLETNDAALSYDPLRGRTLVGSIGDHLGTGLGTAAGVKLARPDKQVVCLLGDGAFLFGPQALWTMVRSEIPVIVVVYNNKAYNGTKERSLALTEGGRMNETGHMVHYYLGNPDIDFVGLAAALGVSGEKVVSPNQIAPAWKRALATTRDGKPYVIEAEVQRSGQWTDNPWYPQLSLARQRSRMV